MTKSRHKELLAVAKSTLKTYQGREYPTDAKQLADKLSIPIYRYDELTEGKIKLYGAKLQSDGFTAYDNKQKTIYYNADLDNANNTIMHELAHCILGHDEIAPQNESEAQALAYMLTYPQNNSKIFLRAVGVLVVCVCMAFGGGYAMHSQLNPPAAPTIADNAIIERIDLPVPSNITTANQQVYVTKSGEKYHLPDCRYIKGKDTQSISISDAIKQGYGSCSNCIEY